jgi:hypothetical protein
MGDRGNIYIEEAEGRGVFLYTHWGGYRIADVLAAALSSDAGRNRANDAPYLARIIFDALADGEHGTETGYGISSSICDNEHVILAVNPATRTVRPVDESCRTIGDHVSFDAFCADPGGVYKQWDWAYETRNHT